MPLLKLKYYITTNEDTKLCERCLWLISIILKLLLITPNSLLITRKKIIDYFLCPFHRIKFNQLTFFEAYFIGLTEELSGRNYLNRNQMDFP